MLLCAGKFNFLIKGALYMDMTYFYAAIAFMLIIIVREFLKKKYNFDIDKINVRHLKSGLKNEISKYGAHIIKKNTGDKSLVLVDAGTNKATVMATLRQLTGFDYNTAKNIVETAPSKFMVNISEKEADMNKKALEFVGAKVEIK